MWPLHLSPPRTQVGCLVLAAGVLGSACSPSASTDNASADPTPESTSSLNAVSEEQDCASVPADGSQDFATVARRAETREKSIAGFLGLDKRFSRFRQLVKETPAMSGTTTWLKIWDLPGSTIGNDKDGVTVFVPVDEAFDLLDSDTRDAISSGDIGAYELIGHHYVHQLYPSSKFEPGPQPAWRGYGEVQLTLDPPTWGGCNILATDIRLSNGIVHIVGGVVIPPGEGE